MRVFFQRQFKSYPTIFSTLLRSNAYRFFQHFVFCFSIREKAESSYENPNIQLVLTLNFLNIFYGCWGYVVLQISGHFG